MNVMKLKNKKEEDVSKVSILLSYPEASGRNDNVSTFQTPSLLY